MELQKAKKAGEKSILAPDPEPVAFARELGKTEEEVLEGLKSLAPDPELERLSKDEKLAMVEIRVFGELGPAYVLGPEKPLVMFGSVEDWDEVERYWIERPYTLTVILRNKESGDFLYKLVEPVLSDVEEKELEGIREALKDVLPYETTEKREKIFAKKFTEVAQRRGIINPEKAYKFFYRLKRDTLGYSKIDAIMKDPHIEDISCDGAHVPIFLYHRKYYNVKTDVVFSVQELDTFVSVLAERCGKHISYADPVFEARLPDGTRVQATLGKEVTAKHGSFSMRKFLGSTFTPVDLIRFGTFNPEMLAYLWTAIEHRRSVMVIGGTASGKTSTLNALAFFIPPDAKIVSIEDTRELSLYQENWIPNVTREVPGAKEIDMHELVRLAMRQRPECIIVGEVRGKEALAMFQAICTGHIGFATMHAGDIRSLANRLEGEPINLPRPMFAELDIICLQLLTKLGPKRVRRNMRILEFAGLDPVSEEIRVLETFAWDMGTDTFKKVGESHVLREIRKETGMSSMAMRRELKNREKVLRYIIEKPITSTEKIASIIRFYSYDPTNALKQILAEMEAP